MVANEGLTPANRFCIKNLTEGDLLLVRVVAVNPGGRSEPASLAAPVPIREVIGKWQPMPRLGLNMLLDSYQLEQKR